MKPAAGAARWLEPFFIACLLNLLILVAAGLFTSSGITAILTAWSKGFSSLFGFAMQMVLMLVLGNVLAMSPWVYARLAALSRLLVRSPAPALGLVLLTAAISWLHWGLGLIAGAVMARRVYQALPEANPAEQLRLTAAAYAGFLVWHGGWSGSAPLVLATTGHPWQAQLGVIPLSASLFSALNLSLLLLVPLSAGLLLQFMPIKGGAADEQPQEPLISMAAEPRDFGFGVGLLITSLLLFLCLGQTLSFDLNTVIALLFGLGLLLHGNSKSFQQMVKLSAAESSGILVQFPLYGAIMGVMQDSGLASLLSAQILQVANPQTAYVWVFWASGLLNVFVPSGGGQWAIQAPLLIPLIQELGLSPAQTVIAFAWGDAWTNLIQPFWALPVLAMTGVSASHLLPVTARVCLLTGLVASLVFYLFG